MCLIGAKRAAGNNRHISEKDFRRPETIIFCLYCIALLLLSDSLPSAVMCNVLVPLFILLFSQHLLSRCPTSGSVLGVGHTKTQQTGPCPSSAWSLVVEVGR